MKHKKSTFNIHECEGRRDGMTKNGYLLAMKFQMLKNMQTIYGKAPIMAVYQENYNTYKSAFLQAYWSKQS